MNGYPETFERAALQLKRLALAEMETYANNATGCFEALFAPVLGATSAPYDLRMPLLEGMVAGSTPERTLLTKTIRTALGRGGRSGGPPEIQGRAVSEWRPPNIEAYRLIVGQILSILGKLLADSVPEVREEAGKVLADITWELILSGCQKEWAVCCKGLQGGVFESRSRVLERVDALLQYHSRRLSKEVKEEILAVRAELAPQSFAERLRFETSRWPGGSTKDPSKSTRDAARRVKMSELAQILLTDDGVREESLAWLLSGEAHSAWELGEALGEMDTSGSMLPTIEAWAKNGVRDDRFIGGYLGGLRAAGHQSRVEDMLDALGSQPESVEIAASLTHRLGASDRGLARFSRLLRAGALPGGFLNRLTLGFYCRQCSPAEVIDLVDASKRDRSEDARRGRLHLLNQYASEHADAEGMSEALQGAAMDFIDARWNTMDEYVWRQAVGAVKGREERPLAERLLKEVAKQGDRARSFRSDPLFAAFGEIFGRLSADARWTFFAEQVGPALMENVYLGRKLGHLLHGLDTSKLMSWIAEDVQARAWSVAQMATVYGVPMPEIARGLLIRWGGRRDVRGALSATFGTGGGAGPISNFYRDRLAVLDAWEKDPAPQVVSFARWLRPGYEKQLSTALKEEEERPY